MSVFSATLSAHYCCTCHTPLVELLSDAAGRLFGCPRCRSIDGRNALRPAEVTSTRALTKNQRRRSARRGRKGRDPGRRVPKRIETTRPYPNRYAVLRAEMFEHFGRKVRDIGDGWAIGLIESGMMSLMTHRMPAMPPPYDFTAEFATEVRTEVVNLIPIAGTSFGVCDREAPERLALWAFDCLSHERIDSVASNFLLAYGDDMR